MDDVDDDDDDDEYGKSNVCKHVAAAMTAIIAEFVTQCGRHM